MKCFGLSLLLAFATACSASSPVPAGSPGSSGPATVPIGQLPLIDSDRLLQETTMLSSDEFEGRAPGTHGEDLTVRYLETQFKEAGLQPGNTDGTFFQTVPLVGITPAPAPLIFKKGAGKGAPQLTLKWKDDVVAWTKHVAESASISDSEVVFAGYGVIAPEYRWDDFKGTDVKGKTLLVLINDPPVPDPRNPNELDPNTFGGRAMTYYGRWTYKYEMGQRQGRSFALSSVTQPSIDGLLMFLSGVIRSNCSPVLPWTTLNG
jgi:hypothetical protein